MGAEEPMATEVFIYSKRSSPALEEGRGGLEEDLEEFLAGAGEVTGGGGGDRGWNVDLEIWGDVEPWLERLCQFLRDWGVPGDTYLCIFPAGWSGDTQPRHVDVFPPTEALPSAVS